MAEPGLTPSPVPPKKTNWAVLIILTFVGVTVVFGVIAAMVGGPGTTDSLESNEQPQPAAPAYDQVPLATIEGLAHGLETGLSFHPTGYMQKSRSHGNAYYVALRLLGPGMDNTWVYFLVSGSNMDSGIGGGYMAIGAVSTEFVDWPDAAKTDAGARITDAEVQELEDYVKKIEPNDDKASAGVALVRGSA